MIPVKLTVAIGETYGTRIVLDGPSTVRYGRDGKNVHRKWLCRCQCGRIGWVFERNLGGQCRACSTDPLARGGVGNRNATQRIDVRPLGSLPGTEERIRELSDRAERGVAMFHPHDKTLEDVAW